MAELGPDFAEARALFEQVATGDQYVQFLTIPAYERLSTGTASAAMNVSP